MLTLKIDLEKLSLIIMIYNLTVNSASEFDQEVITGLVITMTANELYNFTVWYSDTETDQYIENKNKTFTQEIFED